MLQLKKRCNYIVKIKNYINWFSCSRNTASKIYHSDLSDMNKKIMLYSDVLKIYGDLDNH